MTRQVLLRQSPGHHRQPLSTQDCSSPEGNNRFAEVAGGTAAECAAVCCCCPCSVINLLVLAVYKVPAGLCRKALRRKRRRRLIKKGLLVQGGSSHMRSSYDGADLMIHPAVAAAAAEMMMKSVENDEDVMELEREMWVQFYGTGFWRSPSQRADDDDDV